MWRLSPFPFPTLLPRGTSAAFTAIQGADRTQSPARHSVATTYGRPATASASAGTGALPTTGHALAATYPGGNGGSSAASTQQRLQLLWQEEQLCVDANTGLLYTRPVSAAEWPQLVGRIESQGTQAQHTQLTQRRSAEGVSAGAGGGPEVQQAVLPVTVQEDALAAGQAFFEGIGTQMRAKQLQLR